MSFVYFCVFRANLDYTRLQRPCILCVFVFFLISAKKKADPCVLCVFVFFGWKFRPSYTTHVFLCFLDPGCYGVRHVFCVFLCFLANLVYTRSQHPCILCVFVFFLMSEKKAEPCVLCVFVFFGWKFRPNHTTHVFDGFLCFLIPGGYGVKLVFCVFLCFFGQIWIRPGYNTHVFYVFLCFF